MIRIERILQDQESWREMNSQLHRCRRKLSIKQKDRAEVNT